MISLSYVSSATQRLDDSQLLTLLEECHTHNHKLNVTGLLLYNGQGTFIQVLEGDAEVLEPLYSTIKRDDRHERVNCLGRRTIATRSFPHWKMGYRNLANIDAHCVQGFSNFMQERHSVEYVLDHKNFAHDLLMHFKNAAEEIRIESSV